jgi:hypothetical protein
VIEIEDSPTPNWLRRLLGPASAGTKSNAGLPGLDHHADAERRRLFDIEDIQRRSQYGRMLLWGYIVLLGLFTLLPIILWTVITTFGHPSLFSSGISNVQSFTVDGVVGLNGLAGMAGFVIGRYFPTRLE